MFSWSPDISRTRLSCISPHSPLRRITDYLSIIFLVPTFLAISSGTQLFLQTYIMTDLYDYVLSQTLLTILRCVPYVFTILLLTFIYIVIPNCKVRFLNAFAAAVIAGTAFLLFQWLYIHGQIWVSKYNAIYGSFAALPLLLLWIQMSWIICLYGAELSYASQNIQNYNFENVEEMLSRHDRDFLLILVAGNIYNRFANEEPAPTTEEVGPSTSFAKPTPPTSICPTTGYQAARPTNSPSPPFTTCWLPMAKTS